jgi:SEC-C motif domain protein
MKDNCPCGSNVPYQKCCREFHKDGGCKTALQLMKSRYSAYAKNLPLYIIKTSHPDNPSFQEDRLLWIRELQEFCQKTSFKKLEIVSSKEEGKEGWVHFKAYLRHEEDFILEENSYFLKEGNDWLYVRDSGA